MHQVYYAQFIKETNKVYSATAWTCLKVTAVVWPTIKVAWSSWMCIYDNLWTTRQPGGAKPQV